MIPWTVSHQAPLSMGVSRQENWSGLLCPLPGDLPDPGIEPASLMSPTLQASSLPLVPPGKPLKLPCLTASLFHQTSQKLPIILHILMQSDHLIWYKRESQQALGSVGKIIHNPHNCCGLALMLQKGGNFHTSFQAPNFYWLPVETETSLPIHSPKSRKCLCPVLVFFFLIFQ